MSKIFVQIASYRDTECQKTIEDLFIKAARPERIVVGLFRQERLPADPILVPAGVRPEQLRVVDADYRESRGVCWARGEAQKLLGDEPYVFSVDSHMRFTAGWDEIAIAELESCPGEKTLLSSRPSPYWLPDRLDARPRANVMHPLPFTPEGDLRAGFRIMSKTPEFPLRGAFVSAGYWFGRANVVRDVVYDPYLYFDQEEIALAVRLFTHGYDVYGFRGIVAYHYYYDAAEAVKPYRHHWEDAENWATLRDIGRARLNVLLGVRDRADDESMRDLHLYGLGTQRPLEEFERFVGVDFTAQTVAPRGLSAEFNTDATPYYSAVTEEMCPKPAPPVATFPEAVLEKNKPVFGGSKRKRYDISAIEQNVPNGVLILRNYLSRKHCDTIVRYANRQSYTELGVIAYDQESRTGSGTVLNSNRITHHVAIDGMACDILNLFNDIYCNRAAPFFGATFESYERPQILRYPAGGKYNTHADAEQWDDAIQDWVRVHNRDYSVLLYLNDQYTGGELEFVTQQYKFRPEAGMLVAFPSNHHFLHAAHPTIEGIRYVIVSWATAHGTPRVAKPPAGSRIEVFQQRQQ